MSAVLSAPNLLVRFAAVIELLCRAVAASGPKHPHTLLAWTRLRRLLARFGALVAAVQAGRVPAPRRVRKEAARTRPARPDVLPGGFGWLIRLAPALETRLGGAHVESLLGDPEFAALLASAPQAGRILRPLCHMLRIELPPALRLPRRPRRECRRDVSGSTNPQAERGKAPAAQGTRPELPSWLAPPARPFPPVAGPATAGPWPVRPRPARTGPRPRVPYP